MSVPPLRRLPAVHVLLDDPALRELEARVGRLALRDAARTVIEEAREALRGGEEPPDTGALRQRLQARLGGDRPALRPVLNATGILLHTGLGRAPLAEEAIAAIHGMARGYCSLELDLATGQRGRRVEGVSDLLARLTGAEAATAVNNNAAATILALKALAAGKEVVVSRGELVEIGGSFRLPEIFAVSGARLREVGTTNRTRLADYEAAIGPDTAAILRVHASNYRIVGFTESVEIGPLAALARARGIWAIDDIGSGAIGPGQPPHVRNEPAARDSITAGADLVLFSGDKLLGGPQCGILAGRRAAIDRISGDPLMRALRLDKLTLAALEATLRLALDPVHAARRIPLWAFLNTPLEELDARAQRLAGQIRERLHLAATPQRTQAYLGGGSLPAAPLPSAAVAIDPPAGLAADVLARRLRLGDPAVVGRIHEGAILLDLRAVAATDDPGLLAALEAAGPDGHT